jgi:hypothetical protein
VGETLQLTLDVFPENATNKRVAWHTSNDQVAEVNSNGLVIPVSPGSVTIKAIAQDGSQIAGDAAITVNKMVYDMSAVAWDYQKPFIYDGTQKIVQLVGLPQGVIPAYAQNIAVDPGTYTAFVIFTYDAARPWRRRSVFNGNPEQAAAMDAFRHSGTALPSMSADGRCLSAQIVPDIVSACLQGLQRGYYMISRLAVF